MASESFDLVTIGSGSAAFAAAIRATSLGARVALVERSTVGGTQPFEEFFGSLSGKTGHREQELPL